MGMSTHQNTNLETNTEYLTPPWLIASLGRFHLDPAAADGQPWRTAETQWTAADNGLDKRWFGRVWLNPPYGVNVNQWTRKLALHGNGIALIFARTETRAYFPWVWDYANGILFIKGRLQFHDISGRELEWNGGAPSCLVAYGKRNAQILSNQSYGKYLPII